MDYLHAKKKCIQSVLTLQLKSNLWNRKSLWNGIYASRNTSVGRLTLGSPLIFTVQCMVLSPVAPTLPKISNISLGNGTICKNTIDTWTCISNLSMNGHKVIHIISSLLIKNCLQLTESNRWNLGQVLVVSQRYINMLVSKTNCWPILWSRTKSIVSTSSTRGAGPGT